MRLVGREHLGLFGSLKDSMARAIRDPTALLLSNNTFHDITGSIEKRRGYEFHAEVADQSEPFCAPVIDGKLITGGSLHNSVLYYIRYTYVTAAGETDDLHSSDPLNPGPAVASYEMTGGANAINVSVPFHLRGVTVSDHEILSDTSVRFKIDQTPVAYCDDDIMIGWLVYSRSPRKQDETHLGFNCSAADVTYHRHEHRSNGLLGKVTAYDSVTGWITMDRNSDMADTDYPDDNTFDIMMPDREGLPIRYYNIYISSNNKDFYYAGTNVTGVAVTKVTDHDVTAQGAPSTRVPRDAPTVTAVDVTEDPRDGRCGDWAVKTGIEPGIYSVRVTYLSDDADVMRPPGLEVAQALLDEPIYCYPMKCAQETWPSCRATVCVSDGQGIQVVPNNMPTDVAYKEWRIYTTQLEPFGELHFNDSAAHPSAILDTADNNARPYAYYYPDRDISAAAVLAGDRYNDNGNFRPIGTGNGTDDESGAGNSTHYEGFRYGPANARINPEKDPLTEDWGGNTPSYEDISQPFAVADLDGDPLWSFISSRDDVEKNRFDFNFWMGQDANYADATHAVFFIRMRIPNKAPNAAFRPATAGDTVSIHHYDYSVGSPIALKNGGFDIGQNFYTYYFCIDDPNAKTKTYDGEEFLSFFVRSHTGTPMDIMEVGCWLYDVPGSGCAPLKTMTTADRGTYGLQTAGGDPGLLGAWYSGHGSYTQLQMETNITAATVDTIDPFGARHIPYWEEYGNSTNVPGVSWTPFSGGVITMGSTTPGEIALPHTPAQYAGTTYSGFSISGGYTAGVDYNLDTYNGIVHSIGAGIPDGTVLTVGYNLPYGSWTTTQNYEDIANGFAPSYLDINHVDLTDPRQLNGLMPLWASTRQNVAANRHHWWFNCEDADFTGTPHQLRVEMRIRTRDGGTGTLGAWDAGVDTSRKIRFWDQAAFDASGVVSTSWIDLETDIGGASLLNEWTTLKWAIPYADIRKTFVNSLSDDGFANSNYKYFILDMAGWDYNGFDVDYAKVWIDPEVTDPIPGKDELLRDRIPYGTTTWTLKNPMIEKPIIAATGAWGDCPDWMPEQGEWCPIRRNTTGQWPINVQSMSVVHGAGNSTERLDDYVGCADSVFLSRGGGKLDRVFHEEGTYHGRAVAGDWRFSNYLSRIFFCNTGDPKYNYRFDGIQTWPMGIGWPTSKAELDAGDRDEHGNYNPPGTENDEIDVNEDPCYQLGEQPLGRITSINQTDDEEGDIPEGDETLSPVVCWDMEYYIQWVRIVKTGGRSYIVRSRPRLLTETVNVCVHPDFLPTVTIEMDMCPEPQVTHLEIYRNFQGTARYFRVDRIPVDEAHFDTTTNSVKFSFEDTIPESDEDLTNPMLLETGRPRAARIMQYHQARIWIVPQTNGATVDFTNVTDPAGSPDPEGFWPLHSLIPPMTDASAVTCLSPYHSVLIAHSRQGMCALRGLSSDQNDPSAISAAALHAHAGFVGPDAWTLVDSKLMGMTHEGPSVVLGDEAKVFATDDIEMTNFMLDAETAYGTRVVHYKAKGLSQVWFTFTEDPMSPPGNQVLVFDKASDDVAGGALYWKKWQDLPINSVNITRGRCGDEYPIIGGCDGRLYDFGSVKTDCGVFIESEFLTGWFDEMQGGVSHQPDINYWKVDGHAYEVIYLDVHKDGVQEFMDYEGIPIRMGATISTTDEHDSQARERRVWDEWHMWNDGGVWREKNKDYDEDRTHHRGVFRAIQYRLYQSRALLPAGVDPSMSFRIAGFIPFHRIHSATAASAGV